MPLVFFIWTSGGVFILNGCENMVTMALLVQVKENGGGATISVAKLADGKVRFYKYEDNGEEITFFAAKLQTAASR